RRPRRPSPRLEGLEERVTPSVFGFDDRLQVPTSYMTRAGSPFGAIGLVNVQGVGSGTGFLIGPNLLVTAAHVVHNTEANGLVHQATPANTTIYLGWDGQTAAGGIARVKQVFVPDSWKGHADTAHNTPVTDDYALVVLDQNYGSKANAWFTLSAYDD